MQKNIALAALQVASLVVLPGSFEEGPSVDQFFSFNALHPCMCIFGGIKINILYIHCIYIHCNKTIFEQVYNFSLMLSYENIAVLVRLSQLMTARIS